MPSHSQLTIKRTIDLLISLVAFILFLPVLIVVSISICISSGTPVFFKQVRVGRKCRPFTLYKFRTMESDATGKKPKITSHDDSRITKIGHFLRTTKLDELPQLWNILIGDMSIVGPRPEVPEYVEQFKSDFQDVLCLRPGLTDYASIKYRNESLLMSNSVDSEHLYTTVILPDKLKLAKRYISDCSLKSDIKIIFRTAIAVLANKKDLHVQLDQQPIDSVEEVPYFRPDIQDDEIEEVCDTLRSGWLTTGPKTRRFESEFAAFIGAEHAVAVNSCTAALHLAVEALGLKAGQAVLVPTLTFAATAEIIRYCGAIPLLVDCEEDTLNISLTHAETLISDIRLGHTEHSSNLNIVGIIPVHFGGYMCDMEDVKRFSEKHQLWIVEDAAHAMPAAFRTSSTDRWTACGKNTAAVTCFSFYANKTMTTGEGGMAVTHCPKLESRMRQMALHGLSLDAWDRFSGGSWDYKIAAPGYKYNLTDIASAIGIHQLRRAQNFRDKRREIAGHYSDGFQDSPYIDTPADNPELRQHSWHLFVIRLRHASSQNKIRDKLIKQLQKRKIGTSVHWRPLHLHPYYEREFGYNSNHCVTASRVWQQLVSLPIFPTMERNEIDYVIRNVNELCKILHEASSIASSKAA